MPRRKNGWIVLYTLHHLKSSIFQQNMEDFNEIFIEEKDKKSPQRQARDLYESLLRGDLDDEESQVYSANLCEIKDSTEAHYINI